MNEAFNIYINGSVQLTIENMRNKIIRPCHYYVHACKFERCKITSTSFIMTFIPLSSHFILLLLYNYY